jgi:mannose-6-phosphate isomerase class I
MSKHILRMAPIFQSKIWGGQRLSTVFDYPIPSDHTGECWAISGHPGGDCTVVGGPYDGKTVGWLWKNEPQLFGSLPGDIFPLLIKIIDAKDDLSIQVHPNDEYAGIHENGSLGKTECWYVLDCDEGATIIVGHNASSTEEMAKMVEENRWSELLRQVPIHKGDFFQIDPGCLHAIKGGTLILETQQSSDVTYRFYDYGRLQNGQPRQLHIEKSLAVTKAPYVASNAEPKTFTQGDATVHHLVSCQYYSVYRVELNGKATWNFEAPFVNVSILDGEGTMNGQTVKKGDHLLLTANFGELNVEGNLEFFYSHI